VLAPDLATVGNHERFFPGIHRTTQARQPTLSVHLPSGGTSGEDAYRLMVELYAAFGEAPGPFPYARDREIAADLVQQPR